MYRVCVCVYCRLSLEGQEYFINKGNVNVLIALATQVKSMMKKHSPALVLLLGWVVENNATHQLSDIFMCYCEPYLLRMIALRGKLKTKAR